jgi:hypothetical protein
MMRVFCISVLGMAAISIASAGQIEIGANNGSGITTSGLTSAFVGTTTWAEKNYVTNLFTSDTLSNATTVPSYQNSLQQFTDTNNTAAGGNVTFGMLDDAANTNNYWSSPVSTTSTVSTMTLNVGEIANVSSAYLLLSDYYGVSSAVNNDTVTFIFNGGAFTDPVNLTNGVNIDSVHDCTGPNAGATTPKACPTSPSVNGTTSSANTDIAYSSTYAEANNSTPFSGTAGTATLLDLSFNLSAFSGDVLTGISVTDNNNLSMNSRLALSAVTVAGANATIVPEPSTVFLLLAGFGVIGFLGLRRKVSL